MLDKASDIIVSVLPPVRISAGFQGNPLELFTTNISESINNVIKKEVEWKENKLPALIDHLKAICDRQVEEIHKAVIGRGEWRFETMHKNLEVAEDVWFQMTDDHRKKHLRKVMTATCTSACTPQTPCSSTLKMNYACPASIEDVESTSLDVSIQECGIQTLAQGTLQAIWKKAESLVNTSGHVLPVPWNQKAYFVKSATSDKPHVVKVHPKVTQQYCCDENCPMFKGFSICSHTVAAAHKTGDLHSFVNWYNNEKCEPNLTKIANEGMPKGVGRKGGVPKRKRPRKTTIETCTSRFEPTPKRFLGGAVASVSKTTSSSTAVAI